MDIATDGYFHPDVWDINGVRTMKISERFWLISTRADFNVTSKLLSEVGAGGLLPCFFEPQYNLSIAIR